MQDHDIHHVVQTRVRYAECDPQNVAHHSAYVIWLEMARTELLRQRGIAYRQLEAAGVLFVVVRLNIRYRRPAFYDDVLDIHVRELVEARRKSGSIKLEHTYEIVRDGELLARADTTLACVDRQGKLQRIPEGSLGGTTE
jgi:acyl-CoA thioester hydrolase